MKLNDLSATDSWGPDVRVYQFSALYRDNYRKYYKKTLVSHINMKGGHHEKPLLINE